MKPLFASAENVTEMKRPAQLLTQLTGLTETHLSQETRNGC